MTISKSIRGGLRAALMGTAAIGLVASLGVLPIGSGLTGTAYAQNQSGSGQGGGHQGGSGQGGGGQGGGGLGGGSGVTHGSGQRGDGTSTAPSGSGSGQTVTQGHYGQGGSTGEETGDEGTSEDKKGPNFGGGDDSRKPVPGTTGGRPVWAKEGIPEVELGRLSVARAPANVLNHAFTEVTTNWATTGTTVMTLTAAGQPTLTMTVAQLYSLPATEFARIVQTYYSTILRVDSPLENLSLLKDVRTTGATALTGVTPVSAIDLAAIFLGSASDKTIPVSVDTVTAVNTILQLPALTTAQTAELAAKAEAVRVAIDAGHGA